MGYTHLGAGFVFTKFFSLVFLLGIILFLVWAIRTLDKKQLKKWVIGLVVVGLIGIVGSSLVMMKFGKWDKEGFDKDGKDSKIEYCEKLLKEVETT